jgi:hypothetical protein
MRRLAIATAAGLALSTAFLAAPAQAQDGDAQLSVLHGVPGLTVDVYVNGENTLDDFEPGTLAGPLALPGGTYTVAITAADAADDSEPVLGPIDIDLAGGSNSTAVAHLDADGNPTVSLFDNDVSPAGAGNGRVTVRHVAAAPEVEIVADGTSLGSVANPDELSADVPANTYSVEAQAGGDAVPPTPADVPVTEGASTIVYAWGNFEEAGELSLAVQTIEGLHSAPGGVPGGQAGLVADGGASPALLMLAGLGAAAALVFARRLSGAKA